MLKHKLCSSVADVLNISPFFKGALKRLGITSVADLLMHTPTSIQKRQKFDSLKDLKDFYTMGDRKDIKATFAAEVLEHSPNKNKRAPYKIIMGDGTGSVEIAFFNANAGYIRRLFPFEKKILISGSVDTYLGNISLSHPEYVGSTTKLNSYVGPELVYPLTKGITSNFLHSCVQSILPLLTDLPEWDESVMQAFNLPGFSDSLRYLHNPKVLLEDLEETSSYKQRLAYDELLAHQISMCLRKKELQKTEGIQKKSNGALKQKLLTTLPFQLTSDQLVALQHISDDLESTKLMQRLLQGDVGSGKTIVALLSMLQAIEAGFQATLLAPTDILARQHFETITKRCHSLPISIELFTGKDSQKKRRTAQLSLENGEIHLAIGTHALIQEKITFSNLGLAVIDEQHRFGVEQRNNLTTKGEKVDTLFMSATPIPRTVLLSRYSDLDCSIIKEKPPGRQDIQTSAIPLIKIGELLQSIRKKIESGEQIYWVCPLIEESEVLDFTAAEERFEFLKKALHPFNIGLLHGRLSSEDKAAEMEKFIINDTHLLVSTTVIEVGVDVSNATVMIIEHAERFGLAQLHQLRGRVGRNDKKSACVLLYGNPLTDIAQERLQIMRETNDGFKIAEKDLMLRGGGDLVGTKQSGWQTYKFANPIVHKNLMEYAYIQAQTIVQESKFSADHQTLLEIFNRHKIIELISAG